MDGNKEIYAAAVPAVGMAFCRPQGCSGPVPTDAGDNMAEFQDEELKNHWVWIILYQFIKYHTAEKTLTDRFFLTTGR